MKNIVKISVGLALILPTLMLADTIYIGGHGGAGAPGSRGGDEYLIGEAGGNGGGAGGPGAPAKVVNTDSSRGSHSGNHNGNGNGVNTHTKSR